MKSNRYDKTSIRKRFLFSDFFTKIYYFLAFHIYLILTIVGVGLSIALILFFAELLFPQVVHFFNYSLTDKVFTELVNDHKYHAAIAFMDTKKDVINDDDTSYKYRYELADCYTHIGDYPKALEQYRLLREQLQQMIKEAPTEDITEVDKRKFMDMIEINLLKEEFHIYLRMGDLTNIRNYIKTLSQKHNSIDWDSIFELLSEEQQKKLNDALDGHKIEEGFILELIQGKYIENPKAGIEAMENYTLDVFESKKYNPVYKLRLFNELIRMLLEQDQTIAARYYLEHALRITDSLEYTYVTYSQLGELSEHCYQLDDISDGRRLLKKYLSYIDDTYDKTDIEYALAHAKEFKYLQAEGDWDKLTKRVTESSRSIREQITNNFTGMTSAQREYFIEQFMPLFNYVNGLMEQRPSAALAKVAFDNNMFLRGLLLRSETSVNNAIAAMKNPELTEKYNKFISLSQELVARQYISGPGNFFRKQQLEKELQQLETDIAAQSMEFRRENERANFTSDQLRKNLDSKEIAFQIIEGNETYYALVLDKSGKVDYIPFGSKTEVNELMSNRSGIYTDHSLTQSITSKLLPIVKGKDIYLTSSGIFNKVALDAIPTGADNNIMGDMTNIHLVGSPTEIVPVKERNVTMTLANRTTILWGGVDYGTPNDTILSFTATNDNALLRGEELRFLPGSLTEVNEISKLLRAYGGNPIIISGKNATEKSLTSRSHKNDYILHISTHGFFHDNGAFTNPMQNAGLLFADSQQYWMNDSIATTLTETDGILRADEIATLDLSGCRLVVLSACQTGLGKSNSEGVYGLQRAFKLAGAKSILMSLWSVDDAATRELMQSFYTALINGQTPDEALTEAKNQMRREGKSPSKWAAFVLLN